MKTDDAHFLISNKVADPNNLGIFENSFYLSNYENFLKKDKDSKDDADKVKQEDHDPRKDKIRRKVANYSISAEDSSILESEENKF